MRRLLCLFALLTGCVSVPSESQGSLRPKQLNATKDSLDGIHVKVVGWMRAEFEHYGIWQSREASDKGSFYQDCVSLLIPKSMNSSKYNKRYVQVQGVFHKKDPTDILFIGGCNITVLILDEDVQPVILKDRRAQ